MQENKPYNLGDQYENDIFEVCKKKKILKKNSERGQASSNSDLIFVHQNKEYNLEVKADLNADFGQKYLNWSIESGWQWSKPDEVTDFYDQFNVIGLINNKFVPRKYTLDNDQITEEDKIFDQRSFEKPNIECDIKGLYKYYKSKNCFYLQLENYGFYHLDSDIANLDTAQFDGTVSLRLRCKTNHSIPIHKYSFLAVLKMKKKPTISKFNLENDSKFPNINP